MIRTPREFRSAVLALAIEAGIECPSVSVDMVLWHHGSDGAETAHFGASIHAGYSMPAHVSALSGDTGASPDTVLASLRAQLQRAGYTRLGPPPETLPLAILDAEVQS